jgi:hypothetical protein
MRVIPLFITDAENAHVGGWKSFPLWNSEYSIQVGERKMYKYLAYHFSLTCEEAYLSLYNDEHRASWWMRVKIRRIDLRFKLSCWWTGRDTFTKDNLFRPSGWEKFFQLGSVALFSHSGRGLPMLLSVGPKILLVDESHVWYYQVGSRLSCWWTENIRFTTAVIFRPSGGEQFLLL